MNHLFIFFNPAYVLGNPLSEGKGHLDQCKKETNMTDGKFKNFNNYISL